MLCVAHVACVLFVTSSVHPFYRQNFEVQPGGEGSLVWGPQNYLFL